MQPNSSNTTELNNNRTSPKTIWLISQDNSLNEALSNHHLLPCAFGATLGEEPAAIIFDPDHHAVKVCSEQIAMYKSRYRNTPLLVYSCWASPESVFPLLKAGADGYLLKTCENLDIEKSIDEAISGVSPLSSEITSIILDSTRRHLPGEVKTFGLKSREIELLQMMSEGLTKKDISQKFDRSVHTIDNHVRKIYLKMDVNNLGEAVGKAFRSGIIS